MNTRCVLLVSPDSSALEQALAPFRNDGFSVRAAKSLAEALPLLDPLSPPSLVLLDARQDADGSALRRDAMAVLSRCALTYLSAVSQLDSHAFHDAMEGLGMLPPLPAQPTAEDGAALLATLRKFLPQG